MDHSVLILIATIAALAHYFLVARHQGVLTLDGLFVLSQWAMATGALFLLEDNRADNLYAWIITVPMFLYIAASIATHSILRGRMEGTPAPKARVVENYRPTIAIWALLILAGVATTAYFLALGYNVLSLGIQNLLSGSTANYTDLRLNSYNGHRYLYPGYVNQFKNTILPALTLVVVVHLFTTRNRHRVIISVPLIVLSAFGVLGTGQRGAFVLFLLTLMTYLFHADRTHFRRRAFRTTVTTLPLLMLATVILGRSEQALQNDSSPFAKVLTIAQELFRRLFYDNQQSGQMGFRYTYGLPTQNGREWLRGLLGVLPGNSGSTLSNKIFATLYGSERGTSPPSMWGSVFYNFGWFGLLILPIVIAVIYQSVTFRAQMKSKLNVLELIGMSGTFVVFGNWIAGGPEYILNAGGVTFAVLWWLGRRVKPRSQAQFANQISVPAATRQRTTRGLL
jgi:oligosaccharide repeat unit polymerase